MPVKTAFLVVLMSLAAPAAYAMCQDGHKTVSDCAPGESRDAVTGQCIKPVSS
jgi:hypothetical protein